MIALTTVRDGQAFDITPAELTRFTTKLTENKNGCWIWNGALNSKGYGCLGLRKRSWLAHRLAYEMCVGPILDGLHIDHLCAVKTCVNPAHLEAVTCMVNNQRAAWYRSNDPRKRVAAIRRDEAGRQKAEEEHRAHMERFQLGLCLRACYPGRWKYYVALDRFQAEQEAVAS